MLERLRRLFAKKEGNFRRYKMPNGNWGIEVVPALRFKPVTLAQVETVSPLLGIDVDILMSGDFETGEIKTPAYTKSKRLINVLLDNPEDYVVDDWSPEVFEGFLAYLVGFFLSRLYIN